MPCAPCDKHTPSLMTTSTDQLSRLEIPGDKKARRKGGPILIIVIVALVVLASLLVFANARKSGNPNTGKPTTPSVTPAVTASKLGDAVLTVSGYVIPHERI